MTPFLRNAIIISILMLGASMLSIAITPTINDEPIQFDLEKLVPQQFGDWRKDEQVIPIIDNPQTKELINKLYSQTLSRTYINNDGRRIMLSMAYGKDQLHDTKLHRPEVCYPSQGFQLTNKWYDVVHVGPATLPVMRIVAQHGNRHEPVTYWLRVGGSLVRGPVEQSFTRIIHGLAGHIPDGILFRVSEINSDTQSSIALQDQFIRELLLSLTPADQEILIGTISLMVKTDRND